MDARTQLRELLFKLTANQAALRKIAVREEAIAEYRYRHTWHRSPLPLRWVSTIGCWGGVTMPDKLPVLLRGTLDEDGAEIEGGISWNGVRVFQHRYQVTTRARGKARGKYLKQWSLAHEAYLAVGQGAPEEVAARLGILPVELRIYSMYVGQIIQECRLDPKLPGFQDELSAAVLLHWEPYNDIIAKITYEVADEEDVHGGAPPSSSRLPGQPPEV